MIHEQLYGSSGLSNGEDKRENVWRIGGGREEVADNVSPRH